MKVNIPENVFKTYDIRAIYPDEINEENLPIIIKSIYNFLCKAAKKDKITIALGRDMRLSSPSLFKTAINTLEQSGALIIDIGLVSTPSFYYSVLKYEYDGGIQISASHNPKEYTGLKIVRREGHKIVKIGKTTGMDEIKENALKGLDSKNKENGSITTNSNVLEDEIKDLIKEIGIDSLNPLKVVADPANSMGILYLEELFKNIPGQLIKMNFELDGSFPSHQPDPLQFDTLKDLQKRVIDEKADLGIAPDGDGDRVFFIDEKGEVVPATSISALITNEILKKNPSEKIIVDVRYTNNIKNLCKKYGAKMLISKVGHALITELMNQEDAAFAGESSGHFYFRQNGGAESSLRVILMILKLISRNNKKFSEISKEYIASYESGEFNFLLDQSISSSEILNSFEETYKEGTISKLDGLAIDFDNWRTSIRSSNTEPLLRINVEANSKEILNENLQNILKKMASFGAKRK